MKPAPQQSLQSTFFEEALDLLDVIESGISRLHDPAERGEAINAVFRAAHTIKGSAGVAGVGHLVPFTHALEAVLERLRDQQLPVDGPIISLLTEANDELIKSIDASIRGETVEPSPALHQRLSAATGGVSSSLPTAPAPVVSAAPAREWFLSAVFEREAFARGVDPIDLVHNLQKMGQVDAITFEPSWPEADTAFDHRRCYLTLRAVVSSRRSEAEFTSLFELVQPACTVTFEAMQGAFFDDEPAAEPVAAQPQVQGPSPERAAPPPPTETTRTVKIPAARLDSLIDMVSELVIASSGADTRAERAGDRGTIEALASVRKLVSSIRDASLGLRMVAIGETFNRLRRSVRELSAQLGKEVDVELRGAETELDKAMVERLSDPLIHVIRNALDHGLESPEARVAAGKPRRGVLTLDARHQSGQVVIEVRDDGAGLNRAKIKRKAIEKGLISPGAVLTDGQTDELIFMPGFSSADTVTSVSGRGVGMDVVRRSVDQLRGTVEIESTEGRGTMIRLRLPLTLAIIDGFLLEVAGATYVVPSKLVRECLDFASLLDSAENHRLNVRNEPVPYIRLRELFHLEGDVPTRESLVLLEYGDRRLGLVVDRLIGVSQTVIKSLGALLNKTPAIGGSTILGSGEVGLILDIPQLVRLASAGTSEVPRGNRHQTMEQLRSA